MDTGMRRVGSPAKHRTAFALDFDLATDRRFEQPGCSMFIADSLLQEQATLGCAGVARWFKLGGGEFGEFLFIESGRRETVGGFAEGGVGGAPVHTPRARPGG